MTELNKINGNFSRVIVVLSLLFLSGFHWWDPVARWTGIGNSELDQGNGEAATEAFKQAESTDPGNDKILYNQALAKLQTENPEEALQLLTSITESNDPDVKASAWYNKGCIELQSGQVGEAVKSFSETLKLRPDDMDAKTNLEIALMLPTPTPPPDQNQQQDNQEQQENQEQDQDQEQSQDQENKDQGESQEDQQAQPTATPTQSPESQENQQQEQKDQEQKEQEQEQETSPQPVEEGKMSRSEAERLLDAQEEDEMEVLKRFHQLPPTDERKIEKDW